MRSPALQVERAKQRERARVLEDAEWERKVAQTVTSLTGVGLVEIEPTDECHRCDHTAKWHKADWHCTHPQGITHGQPGRCLCDGFVPKTAKEPQ